MPAPPHPTTRNPALSLPPPLLPQCGMKPVCLKSALRFGLGDHCPWAPGGSPSCLSTPFPGGAWCFSCYLQNSVGVEGPREEIGGFVLASLAPAGGLRIPEGQYHRPPPHTQTLLPSLSVPTLIPSPSLSPSNPRTDVSLGRGG